MWNIIDFADSGCVVQRLLSTGGYESDEDFKSTPPSGDGVLGGADAYAGGNEAFRVDDVPQPAATYGAAPAMDHGSYNAAPAADYGGYGGMPAAAQYAAVGSGHPGGSSR